jgi:hypothetical protein
MSCCRGRVVPLSVLKMRPSGAVCSRPAQLENSMPDATHDAVYNWAMRKKMKGSAAVLFAAFGLWALLAGAPPPVADLSFTDARPILQAMEEVLPPILRARNAEAQAAQWPAWLSAFNTEVRARLRRGDEDTLVNFLLFGTSFTSQPRLSAADFQPVPGQSGTGSSPLSVFTLRTQKILRGRMADLALALANPGKNERLLFFRDLVALQDAKTGTAAGPGRLSDYLTFSLARVLKEAAAYAEALQAARKSGDASAEFAERSTLFRDRGLSVDTSLAPDFALEESLKAMRDQKFVAPGSIVRVAIIGPGLDFADKDAGYDFYPPQTIQPFALMDSLIRLGLARAEALEITTLDVSPRVNDHINRARRQALKGSPYALQLPRDARITWKADYQRYWERFGDQIGRATRPASLPSGLTGTAVRSVLIRPDVVARIHPVDLNIVTQHLALEVPHQFDLMIATNVFVYYDIFQQSLALANIERMLRPGAFLLSNNALLELPFSKIRSVGYQATAYSDRGTDGDDIVWYRRQ